MSRPARIVFASLLAAMAGHAMAQTTADPSKAPSLAATIDAMPKNLPRAEAPGLMESVDAAFAAQKVCAAKGAAISVLVVDVVGKPVVLLSGDGAGFRSQLIAQTKVNIVARYGQSSGVVADQAIAKPELTKAAAADPEIGMLRSGGLPVRRGGKMIGIVGVSGASLVGGDLTLDETCAKAAVAKLEGR